MLYSLDEICLIPAKTSAIEHRGDTVVFDNHDRYPLFVAPMSCIVNENNYQCYVNNRVNVIIPRSVLWQTRLSLLLEGCWVAVGLKEAQWIYDTLDTTLKSTSKIRICIDQANGHMESLLKLCCQLKDKFGDKLKLMTGNIANPNAYKEYARAGVDFIRIGIGGGSACTTSVKTGMHYPMGSLIIKCKEEKELVEKGIALGAKFRSVPRIVADGGFKNNDHIVKALALGADYVMVGSVIAGLDETNTAQCLGHYKTYYGMSTEEAQVEINEASLFKDDNFVPKHSEGVSTEVIVMSTLEDWLSEFEHDLKSSMSYAGTRTLNEYKGNVRWDTMSVHAHNVYTK